MLLSRARGGGLTRIHGIVNRGYWGGGVLGGANRIETMAQHLGKLGWLVALVLTVVLGCFVSLSRRTAGFTGINGGAGDGMFCGFVLVD